MRHPRSSHETGELTGSATAALPAASLQGASRWPAGFSIETSSGGLDVLSRAAEVLAPRTDVYVPKLPRRMHADGLDQVRLLAELGFRPVPHVAARDIGSRKELEEFVGQAVRASGTDRLLVIGGDTEAAAGPYADSAAVIGSGILEACGITQVDVAGYPDGHPRIPPAVLDDDMARKVDLARGRNLKLAVVTQFSFSSAGIADYCESLARVAPGVPVRAGVVGPTSPRRLLQFARICGVATSLRAVEKLGLDSLRLVMQADPGRQFRELARRCAAGRAGNLVGIHVFTFGGFVEAAAWIREYAGHLAGAVESGDED